MVCRLRPQFWTDLHNKYPQLTPAQVKAINKLYDAGPEGFAGGMSTEKYVNLCSVSRATAYREFTALCEMGVRRYQLDQPNGSA